MLVLEGEHPVAKLAFTPDGTRLVVARANYYPPEVWPSEVRSLATGECLRLWTQKTKCYPALTVHPSGRLAFFAYGHSISIYATEHLLSVVSLADGTGRSVGGHFADDVVASPDGKWVVTSGGNPRAFVGYRCDPEAKTVCTENWRAESHVVSERLGGFVGSGDRFATVGGYRIVVRDTETGEVRATARHSSPDVGGLVTSPDGGLLAGQSGTQFYVWDTATWEKRLQLPTENRPFASYAFHPTRPILAVIQSGQTLIKYLDVNTGAITRKFRWKLGEMRAVCFSPDGTLAAAGAANGKIVVWDVDE
ncbi:MAG: hypothetical protein J0I06_25375 [Planctomycetes bacterium]|nr:hypothetical protein [Planctomycetota bacterium]